MGRSVDSMFVALAMGRFGDICGECSGDIFVTLSTAHAELRSEQTEPVLLRGGPNAWPSPLFEAAVQATEEAIVNAMVVADWPTP